MRFSKLSALFLTTAISMGVAGTANAMDNGEQGTPQEISTKLKAENQHLLARADLMSSNGKLQGMFFTVSSDRSVGYIIQSDKPFGETATRFTVYRRLADVRVYDARVPAPEQVFLKAGDAVAKAKCKQLESSGALPKDTCVAYNKTIRNDEQRGQRPMIQGFNVRKNADGSHSPDGTLITVSANIGTSNLPKSVTDGVISSIFYTSLPDGATILNATLSYANYEPYGLALLEQEKKARRAEK